MRLVSPSSRDRLLLIFREPGSASGGLVYARSLTAAHTPLHLLQFLPVWRVSFLVNVLVFTLNESFMMRGISSTVFARAQRTSGPVDGISNDCHMEFRKGSLRKQDMLWRPAELGSNPRSFSDKWSNFYFLICKQIFVACRIIVDTQQSVAVIVINFVSPTSFRDRTNSNLTHFVQ